MLKINDVNNFRRIGVELCLIAAPFVGLMSAFITPRFTDGMGEELAAISKHTERWLVGEFLNLITFFLFMLAALAVMYVLRRRSVILGHVGADWSSWARSSTRPSSASRSSRCRWSRAGA